MRYDVTFNVVGYFTAGVEADSLEQAIEFATEEFSEADCGEFFNIEGEVVFVEDESGPVVY